MTIVSFKDRRQLGQILGQAGAQLGVRVQYPFIFDDAGEACEFAALFPDFGGANGTIVDIYDVEFGASSVHRAAAKRSGKYFSFVNLSAFRGDPIGELKHALQDWGYYGDERIRPDWLAQ
jgi:hypothetical protein